MSQKKHRSILPYAVSVLIVVLIILLVYLILNRMFPELTGMLARGDEAEITEYLREQGMWKGMAVIYVICLLQVASIVIPGMAIQISAGLIYGWWRAFLICYFGFVSGQSIVFYAARALHRKIDEYMESMKAVQKLTAMINSNNPSFTVALACMVPGVPNGSIPYVASRAHIRVSRFAAAVASTSWIQILCNCCAGHFLIRGQYFYTVISLAFQICLTIYVTAHRDIIRPFYEKW